MGLQFPPAWRAYLQREAWFHRGWLLSGAYLWLYGPEATVNVWRIWTDLDLDDRPGMVAIGSDGASELITLDARDPLSPVTCTANVSAGWADSIRQTESIESFLDAVENGSFEFWFDDDAVE